MQLFNDIENIEILQLEIRISDYFPFMRAAQYIRDLLKNNDNFSIEEAEQMLSHMNHYIQQFSDKLKICAQQCFYPLQAPYFECVVRYNDMIPVFFPSSYCRPVQYQKIKDELFDLKNSYLFLTNELLLKIQIKNQKDEVETLKAGFEQSKGRTIDIISAFTAIIAFIFGTIDFFATNKSESFNQNIYSVTSFGIVLLIFVSGISFITMRYERDWSNYFKHPRMWISVVVTLLLVLLLIYLVVCVAPCL